MALGVDRAFPETLSQMEHKGYGRWKTRIPEFIRGGHPRPQAHVQGAGEGTGTAPGPGAREPDKERSGNKKTVTMAPTSRYMTGRSQYVVRKPLIATERQTSILKNPLPQRSEREVQPVSSSSEAYHYKEREFKSKLTDKGTPDGHSFSRSDAFFPSTSREDLTTPLSTADLRLWSSREEPVFGSAFPDSSYSRHSLSSPPLDIQGLTVELSPTSTSTQRSTSPSYAPSSRLSRRTRVELHRVPVGDPILSAGSSLGYSKCRPSTLHQMSPYQANYWTCAIPSSLPPSPDRKSPSWDPDKEYQALLDYTYPLRPNHVSAWDSAECGSLLQTDPLLQDSGIELDHFCSSSSLSCLDQALNTTRRGLGACQRSPEPRGLNLRELSHSKSSDGRLSSSLYSSVDQIGLSFESLDCEGKAGRQWLHYRKLGVFSASRSAPTFIASTRVLPHPGALGDWDEEFLPLPDQLQELQVLSHQLRDITAQVSQPVTASWESLEQETSSVRSLTVPAEKQSARATAVREEEEEEDEEDGGSVQEAPHRSREPSEQAKGLGARLQTISSEVNRGSLREVESIMDQLSGVSLAPTDQGDTETEGSLMQHIQAFCSNLEELIQWLYKVVEKMEALCPPTVDIESVKASLADYKSFQKEVNAHQPLTVAVLETGEMLLHCMNSTSPVLKETLVLIERQSRALETHAEHLFSSILSAMDSLTEPSAKEAIAEGPE